jgi:hypothetical protein
MRTASPVAVAVSWSPAIAPILSRADRRYALGVCLIVYLLSRGLVVLSARLVERRRRRHHGDGGGGGRGGRGGGDGSELVLAA